MTPTEIILHASATRPEWLKSRPLSRKIAEIDSWHRARGFRKIGYHWVVDRDGTTLPGRSETEQGAHVKGHNRNTLGICLIGGFGGAATDKFNDHFTAAQRIALTDLIADIQTRHKITKLSGHNEYSVKACPCFYARSEFTLTGGKTPSLFAWVIALIMKIFTRG
jgi:hypothetical protein